MRWQTLYRTLPFQFFCVVLAAQLTLSSLVRADEQTPKVADHKITPIEWSQFGYHRVALVSPAVVLGNPQANLRLHVEAAERADKDSAQIVLFPELSLTGYSAENHFLNSGFLEQTKSALKDLVAASKAWPRLVLVAGAPYRLSDGRLYNVAFVISNGQVKGAVPKTFLPENGEFYEYHWFTPAGGIDRVIKDPEIGKFRLSANQIFHIGDLAFAIEICEDVWAPIPPSSYHALAGANLILNLSASNELVGKADFRRQMIQQQSAKTITAYAYVSSGPSESARDIVYGGHTIVAENGHILAESPRFSQHGQYTLADIDTNKLINDRATNTTFRVSPRPKAAYHDVQLADSARDLSDLKRVFSQNPFVPADENMDRVNTEILEILKTGLISKMRETNSQQLVIGVSGGLDSAWALIVAIEAMKTLGLPLTNIHGLTMPGPGSTAATQSDAMKLMAAFGVSSQEISIAQLHHEVLSDLGVDPNEPDITYENAQARLRTMLLFNKANAVGKNGNVLVVGTGDLSELAIGYCTFNADQMSHFGVNSCVPKTLIMHLIKWYASKLEPGDSAKQLLKAIYERPFSAELLPSDGKQMVQITEDKVGPQDLRDFFLYHFERNNFSPAKVFALATQTFREKYTPEFIYKWERHYLNRFGNNRFKTTAQPAGVQVGTVSLSPRNRRYPDGSTAHSCQFLLTNLDEFYQRQSVAGVDDGSHTETQKAIAK